MTQNQLKYLTHTKKSDNILQHIIIQGKVLEMKTKYNVGIIGAGSWGTALAYLLAGNGHRVTLWSALKEEIAMLAEHRELSCIVEQVFSGTAILDKKSSRFFFMSKNNMKVKMSIGKYN